MEKFNPREGERLIRLIGAYDAISEFVLLNYGPKVETSEGLADIYADTFRGALLEGFPADESTWEVWVEASERVLQNPKQS